MSGPEQDAIYIRASSSNNGFTFVLIGLLAIVVGAIVISLLPKTLFLVGVFVCTVGLIAIVMGAFKLREPKHSLTISKRGIVYHHRLGSWCFEWHNLQRVDIPKVTKGFEQVELEMIGFRLKNNDVLLDNISPRLITYLLMEQRPLVMQNPAPGCDNGQCYGNDLIEDEKHIRVDGTAIRGISAMFANRMNKLRQGLGYDLFISSNEIDRDADEFIQLIKDCQQSVSLPSRSASPE